MTQMPERDLSDDKWVDGYLSGIEHCLQRGIDTIQVIDPDGRVDKDHVGGNLRRGGAFKSGSVPPRRAKRRAASR
jgi:hypothetical protein